MTVLSEEGGLSVHRFAILLYDKVLSETDPRNASKTAQDASESAGETIC